MSLFVVLLAFGMLRLLVWFFAEALYLFLVSVLASLFLSSVNTHVFWTNLHQNQSCMADNFITSKNVIQFILCSSFFSDSKIKTWGCSVVSLIQDFYCLWTPPWLCISLVHYFCFECSLSFRRVSQNQANIASLLFSLFDLMTVLQLYIFIFTILTPVKHSLLFLFCLFAHVGVLSWHFLFILVRTVQGHDHSNFWQKNNY